MNRFESIKDKVGSFLQEKKWAQDVDVEEGKMKDILGLDSNQKVSEYGGGPKEATQKLVDAVGQKKATGMINYAANLTDDEFLDDMQDALKDIPNK